MNGAGSRKEFGSPPWGPAEPWDPAGHSGLASGTSPSGTSPSGATPSGTTASGTTASGSSAPGTTAGSATAAGTSPGGSKFPGTGDGAAWRAPGGPEAGNARPGDGTKTLGGQGARSPSGGRTGPGKPGARRRRQRKRSFWRELPVLVVVALALALIIKTYAIQAFYIPSGSMQNTLDIGDRVLINKLVYDVRSIHRGDIVVFDGDGSWDLNAPLPSTNPWTKFVANLKSMMGLSHGGDDYVKRVIGVPGDHVACCDAQGRVTVNGVPLDEGSYLYPGNAASLQRFSITVPPGRLWVMGDHRAVSYDSRGHMGDPGGGTIPESAVLGRAFVIIWPVSRWRFLPIPGTFEQPKLNASAAAARENAALAAELDRATIPVRPGGPALPLAFGFAGAVPLTWLQRRARIRLAGRRAGRRAHEDG